MGFLERIKDLRNASFNKDALEYLSAAVGGSIYWDKPSDGMAGTIKFNEGYSTVEIDFRATEHGYYEIYNTVVKSC